MTTQTPPNNSSIYVPLIVMVIIHEQEIVREPQHDNVLDVEPLKIYVIDIVVVFTGPIPSTIQVSIVFQTLLTSLSDARV